MSQQLRKTIFRRILTVDWKIQEIGIGGGREFNPTWDTEGKGLNVGFWVQRVSNFKKYNSRPELNPTEPPTRVDYVFPSTRAKNSLVRRLMKP